MNTSTSKRNSQAKPTKSYFIYSLLFLKKKIYICIVGALLAYKINMGVFWVTLYNDKRIRCTVNYEGKSMITVHSIVAINYFKTVIIKSGHKKWVTPHAHYRELSR